MPEVVAKTNDRDERFRLATSMMLAGKPLGAIANSMGICPATLYNWRQRRDFQAVLAEEAAARITQAQCTVIGAAPKAARHLVARIDDDDHPALADAAAREILDRAGVVRGWRPELPPAAAAGTDLSRATDDELDAMIREHEKAAAIGELARRGRIIDAGEIQHLRQRVSPDDNDA